MHYNYGKYAFSRNFIGILYDLWKDGGDGHEEGIEGVDLGCTGLRRVGVGLEMKY